MFKLKRLDYNFKVAAYMYCLYLRESIDIERDLKDALCIINPAKLFNGEGYRFYLNPTFTHNELLETISEIVTKKSPHSCNISNVSFNLKFREKGVTISNSTGNFGYCECGQFYKIANWEWEKAENQADAMGIPYKETK